MKVLLISGSPTKDGSCETLLNTVARGVREAANSEVTVEFFRLNELTFRACQACGESPEPEVCFFKDDLWPVYQSLIGCDIVVVGSPVFFDSVSAQTKALIDRCSCFRPPDYAGETEHDFKKLGFRRRVGGAVLVAGERGRFDLARSVLKGFFKWIEVDVEGFITFESSNFNQPALAQEDSEAQSSALALGRDLFQAAEKLKAG
jgi:multimeric flavodoxin WrbA